MKLPGLSNIRIKFTYFITFCALLAILAFTLFFTPIVNFKSIFNSRSNFSTVFSSSSDSTTSNVLIFIIPPGELATSTPTTTEQASTTLATTTPSILPVNFCFTKNLFPFTSAPDVKYLQIFLNNQNFNSTSKGSENDYYATGTIDAVASFQEYYSKDILKPSGLSSGTGNFGTATRLKANNILGCPPPPIPVISTTTPIIPKVEPTQVTSTEPITENNLFSNIIESIRQSYGQALLVLSDSIKTAREIINSPSGSAITKTISTASLVLGSSIALGAIAFANPITFSEIWFIPGRIFGLLIGALGIKKKARPWGTVYDSVTKRPLDPVYVTLIDMRTNKEVASAITDLDGRYGFLVLPGKYKISVQKTNYIFPSQKMSGILFDEVYNDLYFGNEITVTTEEETITKNIPMDSKSFDWNEFTKNKSNINSFIKGKDITWAKISKTVFAMGALISIIALIFAPRPYNLIIAILYAVAYIFNYFVFKVKKPGIIMEKSTGLPLSFGIVKIFREGMSDNAPIVKKITDRYGRYYSLVPKGNYHLEIDKKNNDESYSQVFKSKVINVKKGIINEDFEVESAHTAHTHQSIHRKK